MLTLTLTVSLTLTRTCPYPNPHPHPLTYPHPHPKPNPNPKPRPKPKPNLSPSLSQTLSPNPNPNAYPGEPGVRAALSAELRAVLAPFVAWLHEAEEEVHALHEALQRIVKRIFFTRREILPVYKAV